MALSTNCWKYLLLTFNALFAVSSLVLFGVTGYLIYKLFIFRQFLGVNVQYPAIVLLMMAIITCSVAWIGWRTTKARHYFHIVVTGILITIVVLIEFSCFVWAMVEWDNLEIEVTTNMKNYFEQTSANKEHNSADSIRWDRLHVRFECCGVSGPNDYSSSGHVPFSCCGQGPLDALHKPYAADCSTLYQRGCGRPLHEYAKEQLILVAMAALGASILQSTGIFCTFFFAQALKDGRRKMHLPGRNVESLRNSSYGSPDDSLLASPSAPAPTLQKY